MHNILNQNVFLRKKHLPLIFQTERTDCALSCIAMIANFHGISLSLSQLKSNYPQYKGGMNLNDVYDILSLQSCLDKRCAKGGVSPLRVAEAIAEAKARLA